VPVDEYLKPQKRFAHLFGPKGHPDMLAQVQADADRNIRRFHLLDETAEV
jgi:pyruvate ferredoxin oxidoreductase beta subunit